MGDLSQLLAEIAQVPDEGSSWREAMRDGDTVGRYEIRREIGRGGFGAVYEAFDPQLGRVVALKALKPGRTRRIFSEEWIQKEAEAVAKLDHPAIVTIFDVGTCPAGAYLVMELLQGETLAERIARGPLPVDEALRVAEQMAEGLSHAHSRGVLHRDLKPANVFLCADGRVKLLDFGLAHLLGTDGSSGAGTPAYMAPEQAAGTAVDERADVYAAAMVLGEMLTGRRPVERATPRGPSPQPPSSKTELMWEAGKAPHPEAASEAAPSLDGVPRPVARVVKAALSVNPEERPRDGGKWLAELRSARLRVDRPRRARRIAAFATAFVVLGLAVAGFATWRIWERQIPGGRPTVAVADFANETGDSELDGISGLLITSLEQGTQLRVLTRSRMIDILQQLGKADVQRIDEPLAREVGRQARANALLLASIRRLGTVLVVEMRALDPLHDEYVFTVSEQATAKEAIFPLVDRLAATTRLRLGVADGAAPPAPAIATITTANPRAWDLYSRALREWYRSSPTNEVESIVRQAVAEDPDFALARLLVLLIRWPVWGSNEEAWLSPEDDARTREQLGEIERVAHRLPEKERILVRTLRLGMEGRWDEVRVLRDQIAAAFPLDKEAQLYAGDVRFHCDEDRAAVPYFKRALQLDPGYRLASSHMIDAIMNAGIAADEAAWLREQAPLAASPREATAFGRAFLAAGLEEEAIPFLRKGLVASGSPWPPPALIRSWLFAGRVHEAEQALREGLSACAAEPRCAGKAPENVLRRLLIETLRGQGRHREALQAWTHVTPPDVGPYVVAQQRLLQAGGAQDHAALEAATRELEGFAAFRERTSSLWLDAVLAASATAMAGRTDLAAPIARMVVEGGAERAPMAGERHMLAAILASSTAGPGETPPAVAAMARHPQVFWRFPGSVLLGHHLRSRGDCAGAIVAYETALAVPWHTVLLEKAIFHPLVLHDLALCHEKMGDLPRARERNGQMLALWANADPDLPLLAEAKALQARLASAAPAAPPPR